MKTSEEIINEIEERISALSEDMYLAPFHMLGTYVISLDALSSLLKFIKEFPTEGGK